MEKIILILFCVYLSSCRENSLSNNDRANYCDSVLKTKYKNDFETKDTSLKNGNVIINYFVYYSDSSFNFLINKSSEYRYKYFIDYYQNRYPYFYRDSVKFTGRYSYPDFQFPKINSSVIPVNFLNNHTILTSQDNLIFDTSTFKANNSFIRLIFENKIINKHYEEQDLVGVFNAYGDSFPTEKEFVYSSTPFKIQRIQLAKKFDLIEFSVLFDLGEVRNLICTYNKKGELIDGIMCGFYDDGNERFISYVDVNGTYNIIKDNYDLFDLNKLSSTKNKKIKYKNTRGRFQYKLSSEGKFELVNKTVKYNKETFELNDFH